MKRTQCHRTLFWHVKDAVGNSEEYLVLPDSDTQQNSNFLLFASQLGKPLQWFGSSGQGHTGWRVGGDGDVSSIPMDVEPISTIEPSTEWTNWRDSLANEMFNDFRSHFISFVCRFDFMILGGKFQWTLRRMFMKIKYRKKFAFDYRSMRSVIFKSLGDKWKNGRAAVLDFVNDGKNTKEDILKPFPSGSSLDQWATFVEYRMGSDFKEASEKNKANRAKQYIPLENIKRIASLWTRCISKIVNLYRISYFFLWYVCLMDQITSYEASGSCSSQEVSQYDSLAMALGSQEHSGRVRGLGLGPTPSQVFGVRALGGSSDPTYTEMQNELTQLCRKVIENEEQTRLKDPKLERMQTFQTSLLQSMSQQTRGSASSKRPMRMWSHEEDKALVDSMLELRLGGTFNADNGLK
ncbi:uncharacterized protein G2W53_032984 [Senna tora]|uniref:Uncharacterized protein n=1 Tax=Senna tora TaxID=362788 RepID=A0A834SYG1_9FABA|nr:uncharacterized protein G2W53_032984 [Senna tora]